jgi:putative endonuclease
VQKNYWVYIMASARNGTLYIGMTNDLLVRVGQHRDGIADGFTKKYGVKMLVYSEIFADVHAAIQRETRLKRQWKLELIEKQNPDWKDFGETLTC